jgi:hypothetical protein
MLADLINYALRDERRKPEGKRRTFREIREAILTDHFIKYAERPKYRSEIGKILGSRPKRRIATATNSPKGEGLPPPDDDSWYVIAVDGRHAKVCSGDDWEFDVTRLPRSETLELALATPVKLSTNEVPRHVRDRVTSIARMHFSAMKKSRKRAKKTDPRQGNLI